MEKPTICIGENKGADQLRGNREADQRLCFRYSDSTIPLLLKSEIFKLLALLCLSVCVGPVRKPHCWFAHEVAQISCGREVAGRHEPRLERKNDFLRMQKQGRRSTVQILDRLSA